MAVLYRSNMLLRPFEEALRRRHIPHVVIGDLSFWQRQEIKDGMALLKLALMPDSQQSYESFRRVANVPARGLGAKAMAKIQHAAAPTGVPLPTASTQAGPGPNAPQALTAF